jgi:hypothetical protein
LSLPLRYGLDRQGSTGGSCRASCPCQALSASRSKDQACCRCTCSRQLSQRTSSLNWSKTSRGLGRPHRSHRLSGGSTSIRSGSLIGEVPPWSPIASIRFYGLTLALSKQMTPPVRSLAAVGCTGRSRSAEYGCPISPCSEISCRWGRSGQSSSEVHVRDSEKYYYLTEYNATRMPCFFETTM